MLSDNPDFAQSGEAPTRRRPLFTYLILAAFFFLLGLVATAWLLSRWDQGARMIGIAPVPVIEAPPVPQMATPAPVTPVEPAEVAGAPQRIVIDPEITRRVAALERLVGEIGVQSRAAVGNADRAEGLLVAFAARRALDRGVALGFLEALLRQRFGDSQPQAVGTVITAAREPVTLQELQDGLQQVGPQLVGAGPNQSWWQSFRGELGNLVTVRREGTPSAEPNERLRRATRRLEAGQVDVALAEILRLPGHRHAEDWIAKARRYVIARRALDMIETAALLEPRAQAPAPGQAAPTSDVQEGSTRPAEATR